MKKIGIVFAMEEELKTFINKVKVINEKDIYDLHFYETNKCIMVVSGVGKVNAGRTTQVMIDYFEIKCVFNVGIAGGVGNNLKVGDIVIGEKLAQHDFDITAFNHEKGYIPNTNIYLNSSSKLIKITEDVLENNYHKGVIASGDIFVTKKEMSEKINYKFKALCVEMEGASVAQVCYLCKIPFLVLRSISDVPNNDNVLTYEEFLEESSKKISDVLLKVVERIEE